MIALSTLSIEVVSTSVHGEDESVVRGEALHLEAAECSVPPELSELRCRICMDDVEPSQLADGSGVRLDCFCRGDLGAVHAACARAWLERRRSLVCEICNGTISNVPGCVFRPPEGRQEAVSARGRTSRRGRRYRRNLSRGAAGHHPAEVAFAIRVVVPLSFLLAVMLTVFFDLARGLDMLTSLSLAVLGSVLFCGALCPEEPKRRQDSARAPWSS